MLAAVGAAAAAAVYLAETLPSQLKTLDEPSAANVRTATRAGIGAMVPLQATLDGPLRRARPRPPCSAGSTSRAVRSRRAGSG